MIPDVANICALGETAFRNDEFEEAEAWYELACSGKYRDPNPQRSTKHDDLVAARFVRWQQLRAMMYQRSVRMLPAADPGHIVIVQTCGERRLPSSYDPELRACPWLLVRDEKLEGQAKTFFRVLATAARQPGFTRLTLLEDDVTLAENAIEYMGRVRLDEDLAFISWFSIYQHSGPRILPLLNCIEARDYQFNQAITFPAHTVHELLASPVLRDWSEPHGADCIYAKVFPDRKVAIHYPNLVQHVGGTNSLVGNNHQGARTSPSFVGEDIDALSLVR